MIQLFLELVNWMAPRELPAPEPVPQRAPQPLPQPLLKTAPVAKKPAGLPTEASLEELSRTLLTGIGAGELAKRVSVQWNARLQSTAGRAHYHGFKVVLNPRLIEFGNEEIDRTLRHELAHLLAKFRFGRQRIAPHGEEWKQACCDLGLLDEKRTHNLPLPRRVVRRKHAYFCPHCHAVISRVKPFRSRVACLPCCRTLSNGRYDDRFRLVKKQ